MTISLQVLGEASAGPLPNGRRPAMLSVGDSLMWGQGLLPEHRFRELVRARIAKEGAEVVELSMARSGALLDPARNPGASNGDTDLSETLYSHPNPPLQPIYWPGEFAREVPGSSLTTRQQLSDASKLLEGSAPGSASDVRWIILDGGINDVGITGILAPIAAYDEGYFLAGWSAWILDQCKHIEDEMTSTLRHALDLFPNAVIIVNGYFPVFSYWSLGSVTRLQSVGLMYGLTNVVLLSPFGLDALATASSTWQAGSNKRLRAAVRKVSEERSDRVVLFARSNIEEDHSLFAPDTWLWGYDAIPDGVPTSGDQWVQWLAGATPEDEVIRPRLQKCKQLTPAAAEAIKCRLASIGHPNVAGAQDYAASIIEAMEDAGVISSSLGECALGGRRRRKSCDAFSDDWAYECANTDARLGKACAGAVRNVGEAALDQFRDAGGSLNDAGNHLEAGANCFVQPGALADAAQSQFEQAGDSLAQAGEHASAAADCWDDTAAQMQECDDTEASEIAACNAAYSRASNGACDITCDSYKNCKGKYGKWDPRRYTCLTARGVCVAAAATARTVCLAAAAVVREACEAVAWSKSAACKVGIVGGDVICSAGEAARTVGHVFVAGGHALLGGLAAAGELAGDGLCALGELGKAGLDVGRAIGHGFGGALLGLLAGGIFLGCEGLRWVTNRGCRLMNWGAGKLCGLGNSVLTGACYMTFPIRTLAGMNR